MATTAPNFPDPDTVITVLKLTQLSPETTMEGIMDYISTKADDVKVKSVTLLGGGNAKASVSGFTDVDSFLQQRHKIEGHLVEMTLCNEPSYWDQMPIDSNGKEVDVHIVTLEASSEEYKDVESKFNVSMRKGSNYSEIVSIQRVQNTILYKQYVTKKKEMIKRNPSGHKNESQLWHGTCANNVNSINTLGFNHIFQGVHGIVYGKGVYFARDAVYSNKYGCPDSNGHKCIYFTWVLTGEYTVGTSKMALPPPKNTSTDPHVLFDSTVDHQANPAIYVIYSDSQNYPAYLLKYSVQ